MFTYIKTIIKKLSNLISNAYYKVRNKVLGKPKTEDLYDFIKDLDTEDTSVIRKEVSKRRFENQRQPEKFPQLQWEYFTGVFTGRRLSSLIKDAGFIESKASIMAYVKIDPQEREIFQPLLSSVNKNDLYERITYSYLLEMEIEVLYPDIKSHKGIMTLEDVIGEVLNYTEVSPKDRAVIDADVFRSILVGMTARKLDDTFNLKERVKESLPFKEL